MASDNPFQTFQQAGKGFAADMREQGIHVGLGNPARCVTCYEPWPCQGSNQPARSDEGGDE